MVSFELKTAWDLREKLRRDLQRLKDHPKDSDSAFNFFVTAESMRDWVYPGKANNDNKKDLWKNSILLQVCSHLANGAKHFEDERHDSVESTGMPSTYFAPSYFAPSYFAPSYFSGGSQFVVRLKGNAVREFGPVVNLIDLAERVMKFWDDFSNDYPNLIPPTGR